MAEPPTCPRCGRPLQADAAEGLCPACLLDAALNLTPAPGRAGREGRPDLSRSVLRRKRLLHYQLLERIGEGGMGVVYKARDTRLDRLVAIKILPAEAVSDPGRRRRFIHEAKAASALNHPNIVTIYEVACARGVHFIAMEFVAGLTLDQLVGKSGLPAGQVLLYAVPIAGALARAHEAGIVHRDLKPQNIMVRDDGLVKLLDFGLAKLVEADAEERNAEGSKDCRGGARAVPSTRKPEDRSRDADKRRPYMAGTESSRIMGTPGFMAPEQVEGRKVDGRADIFAFGAVLYYALSGRRPFGRPTVDETLRAIVNQEPAALDGVPARVAAIVSRCLAKDPNDRFQTASELQAELRAVSTESATTRVPASGTPTPAKIPEALHCHLLGRQALGSFDPATAREQLEKAVRLDPHFAPAFCALAEVWWYLAFFGVLPPRAAYAQGIWHALRALELDDQFADTHAVLAMYRFHQDHDLAECRRELARARTLDPQSVLVRHYHAVFVGNVDGALEEACGELEAILKVDPLDVASRLWLAILLCWRRDIPGVIEQTRRILAHAPRTAFACYIMAMGLEWAGRHSDAIEAMTSFAVLTERSSHALGGLAWLEGLGGQEAKASALLDELLARAQAGYVPPTAVVIGYSGLGDSDAAVEWFVRAIEARDPWTTILKVNPMWDSLRTHPRYAELLRMMKMEP